VQSAQEKSDFTFQTLPLSLFNRPRMRFLDAKRAEGSSVFLPRESHTDLKYSKLPIHQMILTAN